MSVVAGVSLFDGILLAADCRGSYGNIRRDCVQKLFALAPGTAFGFVGDFAVARQLLPALFEEARRNRNDPYSISRWLPGFLRHQYQTRGCRGEIGFLVGSVLRGHPNIIERELAAALMNRIARGESAVRRNWLDGRYLIPILSTPADTKRVRLPGTSRGVLYSLRSPDFRRERFRPLEFTAIGSGWRTREKLAGLQDLILAGMAGDAWMESDAMRMAVDAYMRDHGDETVGGLIPVMKITSDETAFLGYRVRANVGTSEEVEIGLMASPTGWTQVNVTTRKTRALLPPWEIPESLLPGAPEDRFDDLLNALS
jgi:hypothetical protein